jgi:hypothetical protein
MTKDKDANATNKAVQPSSRTARKKVYERVKETSIPQELHDYFAKDNYDLKLVRWSLNGEEDYRYLTRRENEGYEYVTAAELPEEMQRGVRVIDTKTQLGLVTVGDLCLMKIDKDLRNSRRKFFQELTDQEVASVDVHVLEKKGLRNLGTKSKVIMREPSFKE